MTIGHFMPGIWDHGGIAVYISRIAAAQREAGHTVHFFDVIDRYANGPDPSLRALVVKPEDLAQRSRDLGIDILHLHASIEPVPHDGPALVRTLHDHHAYCPSGERYLKRTKRPCDRVYGAATCLWSHFFDRCGSIRPASLLENFSLTLRERRTLPEMTLIAISHYLKEQMMLSGFDGRSIHVLPNPAPSNRPFASPPRDGPPRFLFLGRLSIHKGIQWLVRCLAGVNRPFFLDIAGDGPLLQTMKDLSISLGIQDRVTFHGWVNEEKIDSLVAQCRAVIFPVVWHEPAGLVSLDAASRGRAVIASRTGGIPEFAIEGRNALIVNPNDDDGLIAAMRTLIDDWDLARRLGEAGYALAEGEFSLPNHIQELDRLYCSLVQDSRDLAEAGSGLRHES